MKRLLYFKEVVQPTDLVSSSSSSSTQNDENGLNVDMKEGEGERIQDVSDLGKMTMKEKEWLIDKDLVFSPSHHINDQDTLHPALRQQQQVLNKEEKGENKHMDGLVWNSNESRIQSSRRQEIAKIDRILGREKEEEMQMQMQMQMQMEEEKDISIHSPLLSPASTTPQHSPLLDRLSASFNDFSSSDQISQISIPPLELPPPPIPPTTEFEIENSSMSVSPEALMDVLDEKEEEMREEVMERPSIEQDIKHLKHIDITDITDDDDNSNNDNETDDYTSNSTLLSKTINMVKRWFSSVTSWL